MDPYQEEFNSKTNAILKQLDPNVLGSFVTAFLIAGLITSKSLWGHAIFDTAIQIMELLGKENGDGSVKVAAMFLSQSPAFCDVPPEKIYDTLNAVIQVRKLDACPDLPK